MAATISANSAGGGGLVSSGDASGVLALQTAGVTALSIDASQKVTFANSLTSPTLVTPVINGMASSILTSGTVQSALTTQVLFSSIPSWVKRITVMFNGVSTNGTSPVQIQLGSTTFSTTGYLSSAAAINSGTGQAGSTTGLLVNQGVLASANISGSVLISLLASNVWVYSGTTLYSASTGAIQMLGGNSPTLAGALDRIRITTVNGTDTFDAGSINIMYE